MNVQEGLLINGGLFDFSYKLIWKAGTKTGETGTRLRASPLGRETHCVHGCGFLVGREVAGLL